jgi:hypothetical protein
MKSSAFSAKFAIIAVLLVTLTPCADAQTASQRSQGNFIDAIAIPTEQQDSLIQEIVQKLAASRVPTSKDAWVLAVRFPVAPVGAVDARALYQVTGLYVIGRDAPGFAAAGDLFWEVRETIAGESVTQVRWVSATTQAVKVLFPWP